MGASEDHAEVVEGTHVRRVKLLTIALVVCILILPSAGLGQQPPGTPDPSNVGYGTLGLLITTKEGMVLAADSRTTYVDTNRHDDHAVKVFRLSEHAGAMIAGIVTQGS